MDSIDDGNAGQAVFGWADDSSQGDLDQGGTLSPLFYSSRVENSTIRENFQKWFCIPLKVLEDLPCRNGGFIILLVSCALYERYVRAILFNNDPCNERPLKNMEIVTQLECDFKPAKQDLCLKFWNICRDGMAHTGMPFTVKDSKNKTKDLSLPPYRLHGSYPQAFSRVTYKGKKIIAIQPKLFMDKVLKLWECAPDKFYDYSLAAPLAYIE